MTETTSGVIMQTLESGVPGILMREMNKRHLVADMLHIGSIGIICPNVEVKIADENGNGK